MLIVSAPSSCLLSYCYIIYLKSKSGMLASAYNLAFVIFPLIVARLMTMDPNYTLVEIFFSGCGFLGLALAIWLKVLDKNGDLDRKEIENVYTD